MPGTTRHTQVSQANLRNFFTGADHFGPALQVGHDCIHSQVDSASKVHGVHPGGDGLASFRVDRAGQHRGARRTWQAPHQDGAKNGRFSPSMLKQINSFPASTDFVQANRQPAQTEQSGPRPGSRTRHIVPSPAASLVALATCFTRLAPKFLTRSLNSMFLATVTPSLVILGPPKLCSITTFRPWGRHHKRVNARLQSVSRSVTDAPDGHQTN